jgi:hypothetical protein
VFTLQIGDGNFKQAQDFVTKNEKKNCFPFSLKRKYLQIHDGLDEYSPILLYLPLLSSQALYSTHSTAIVRFLEDANFSFKAQNSKSIR